MFWEIKDVLVCADEVGKMPTGLSEHFAASSYQLLTRD